MLLNLEGVHTFYGNFPALRGVTLSIEKGEIVTLLGSNGAGKTTLLKTISGILRARSGMITFEGQRIEHLHPNAIVRLGISQCPEGRKLFPEMSVLKNLRLGAYVRRQDKKGIEKSLAEIFQLFPILSERSKQLAGTLSGGEQQKVVMNISDRIVVLNYGQKIAEGSPQEVGRNSAVIEAYLGAGYSET
jgi:branched-chain amino acid transport system ATP-binding protein